MGAVIIPLPLEKIPLFCERWQIREFALFGSVLTDEFRPDSDVDVLVTFDPANAWSLFDHAEMREELAAMFGRRVDLLTRKAVAASRNPYRRHRILSSAQTIYAAA